MEQPPTRGATAKVALTALDGNTDHLVHAVRNGDEAGARDHFSCSMDAWNLLLELANSFGWKPMGTSYAPGSFSAAPDNPTRHDYQPGDQRDSKLVLEADAIGWGAALSEARSSPHVNAMLSHRPGGSTLLTNMLLHTTLDEFITYAFSGAFAFSRSP
jgi:hypothetical protein